MAKTDFLKGFEMKPEQGAKQALKIARHKKLEQDTGKVFPINGVNRIVDVKDAMELGLPEETVKALMTKKSVAKLEEYQNTTQNL